MKYIAYGSNMVQEQMAHRCPDARLIFALRPALWADVSGLTNTGS